MGSPHIRRFALVVALTLAAATTGFAGGEIGEVTPDQLETLLGSKEAVAVDANREAVRDEHGTVPDAILLSSYGSYDPAAELPTDKDRKLVFYCANTMCQAAPAAAAKAREAGYRDVAVMSEGIMGWAKAGKPVAKGEAG